MVGKRLCFVTILSAAALSMSACATDNRAVRGAAIGGAGGAVVGAVTPGISTVEGAAVGAAGGAVVGALTKDGHSHEYCAKRYPVDSADYRRCRD